MKIWNKIIPKCHTKDQPSFQLAFHYLRAKVKSTRVNSPHDQFPHFWCLFPVSCIHGRTGKDGE